MLKQLKFLFFSETRPFVVKSRSSISKAKRASKISKPRRNSEELFLIWNSLAATYFPDRSDLDDYQVTWSSRRQKRVLASCNIRKRKVVMARELLEPDARQWIEAVLYHEMCHAVIGEDVDTSRGKRLWHGAEFKNLEARHPQIQSLQLWINSGGWAIAVRANRTRDAWRRRKNM